MREAQFIIAVSRSYIFDGSRTIENFIEIHPAPTKARASAEAYLAKNRERINAECGAELPILLEEGAWTDLFSKKEGTLRLSIGAETVHITFKADSGEYGVSDDEMIRALDGFVNSSRSGGSYKEVADQIPQRLHRYCQNELWKFVKKIIASLAAAGYDTRNRSAHEQAALTQAFLEEQGF
jgi:hypothetical protein